MGAELGACPNPGRFKAGACINCVRAYTFCFRLYGPPRRLPVPLPKEIDREGIDVEIRLKHVGSGITRPDCGRDCGLADYADDRRWRHLDTMQFTTELVAAVGLEGLLELRGASAYPS